MHYYAGRLRRPQRDFSVQEWQVPSRRTVHIAVDMLYNPGTSIVRTLVLSRNEPGKEAQEARMDQVNIQPQEIRAEDINPRFNWGRALPALGIMGVDFEERVDYRR